MQKFFLSLAALLISLSALRAGGVILYEIGSSDVRLASAGWCARAEDPSTLFTNPAGMSRLCGKQLELGAQPIFSHVRFKPNSHTRAPGGQGHANKWLPSGAFYYVHQVDDCIALGLGSLGYFGSDLSFNHDWAGKRNVQKIMLEGLSLVPAISYRFHDCWSIGAAINLMYGMYKQRTAVNNVLDARPDGFFTLHSYRFGCGAIAGILYEPSPCTRFGLQYLSSVRLNFADKPRFKNIGPVLTDVLTRVGIIGSKLNLHVRVPQGVMLSAYHNLSCSLTLLGNLGWQQWSRFQQITVALADFNRDSFRFKGKFHDTWHIAAGVEWHCLDHLTLSSGVAFDSSPVSDANRQLNFPIGKQWRLGTGFRYFLNDCMKFDLSTELLWQGDLKCDVDKGPSARRVAGKYKDTYGIFTCLDFIWQY